MAQLFQTAFLQPAFAPAPFFCLILVKVQIFDDVSVMGVSLFSLCAHVTPVMSHNIHVELFNTKAYA